MNTWLLIRRLRGPAFLIMFGITALLNQWDMLSFGRSWPLYLILAGVIGLAERAALTAAPPANPLYAGYAGCLLFQPLFHRAGLYRPRPGLDPG